MTDVVAVLDAAIAELTEQIDQLADRRSRLVQARDILQDGGHIHYKHPQVSVGELEGTPSEPVLDSPGDQVDNPAGPEPGADGERHLPDGKIVTAEEAGNPKGPEPSIQASTSPAVTTTLAEILAVLDHPEWVDDAVQKANGAWVRVDGEPWRCSCGRACRNLSNLRSHMHSVINPEAHRPHITACGHTPPADQPPPLSAPISRADTIRHQLAAKPVASVDRSLPYGCRCGSRFPTSRDFADHLKSQPTSARRQHRLDDQPKAAMVDTGVPNPKPHIEPLPPAVAALQDHEKVFPHTTTPGSLVG